MDIKNTLVEIAKKIPGGLFLMCFINAKKFASEFSDVKIEPKKIVFSNYLGKGFGCNCRPVTEELIRRNKGYDLVWIVADPEKQKSDFPPQVRLVKYGTKEQMYEYASAAFWVSNYHLVDLLGHGLRKKSGQYYIQMWHGSFGIKKIEKQVEGLTADKVWLKYSKMNSEITDYWISNSKFENNVYIRSFWDVRGIKEFGHPRNDIFFKAHSNVKTKVKNKLGIAEDEKILLYVPTFRADFSTDCYNINFEIVKRTLEQKTRQKWCVVTRMHPKLVEMDEIFIPKADYIYDATDYGDIQELLAASDAAITDYSSAIFDFMLSYNPAWIYAPDLDEYNTERGFYYDIHKTPFPVAKNNSELCENIAKFDYSEYREKIYSFLERQGSFEDGNATKRVVDLIEEHTF